MKYCRNEDIYKQKQYHGNPRKINTNIIKNDSHCKCLKQIKFKRYVGQEVNTGSYFWKTHMMYYNH